MISEYVHRRLLDMSWSFDGLQSREELVGATVDCIDRTIGTDYLSFNAIDLSSGTAQVSILPGLGLPGPGEAELASVVAEHPAVPLIAAKGRYAAPIRLRDIVSWHHFAHTRVHAVLFEPHNLGHQALIPLGINSDELAGSVYTLNRSRDAFDDEELDLLHSIQLVLAAHHTVLDARSHYPETSLTVRDQEWAVQAQVTLSGREIEVLEMFAIGLTAKAAAACLRISTATVRKHAENAYRKLGAHNAQDAVSKCRRMGLLA